VIVTTMLPILIIPDRATKSDEGPRLEAGHSGPPYCFTPSVWKRPRRTGGRVKVRLGRVIEIRHPLPSVTHGNHSAPASLQDCDQFLKVLLRRKAVSLGRHERAEIGRVLRATSPLPVSALTLSPGTATWLLWAMSWRGVSTAPQIASAPLHAPTLVIQWWASMPGSLCFGPAGQLLRVLGDCSERLYRFWGRVVECMRASGWYLLNPRLVRFKFKPLIPDLNPIVAMDRSIANQALASLVCQSLPTMDNIVVSVAEESTTCGSPQRRNRSGRQQSDTFASAG
jgi:hypothetical protein